MKPEVVELFLKSKYVSVIKGKGGRSFGGEGGVN